MSEKKDMEKRELTFKELYLREKEKPSPAQSFIKEIAQLTKRSEVTVRMWILGRQVPDALAKSMIAEYLGISEDALFPA